MQQSRLHTVAVAAYAGVAALFTAFFLYMFFFQNISVEETRDYADCHSVTDYSAQEIEDPAAPIGIRREFRWTIDQTDTGETALAFYLVHHYAQVYINDELVYSLTLPDTNRFGKSVSSNWVIIPIYSEDAGKEIRIVATPVYESVRNRPIEFQIGSLYTLYRQQLQKDFFQLFLSALCVILGFLIMGVELLLFLRRKSGQWDLFYLGNFTMLLGIWKLSDTRSSPLLFSRNPMTLGYLTMGALFLASIPFMLYLRNHSSEYRTRSTLILSLMASGTALAALFCQISGLADFRQTLILAHLTIIVLFIFLIANFLIRKTFKKDKSSGKSLLPLLIALGALADLITFYYRKSSSGLLFTILAFLIYTLSLFAARMMEISKQAYTDALTGLFNRSRWNMLLQSQNFEDESIGIIILDLNHLKYVNDTMGHKAGDKLIFSFANILRNVIPSTNTICRWGGDEFSILVTNATQEVMEQYVSAIADSASAYNASGEKPQLHYAVGYASSEEYPKASCYTLFEIADERMYKNKQQWYQKHPHP